MDTKREGEVGGFPSLASSFELLSHSVFAISQGDRHSSGFFNGMWQSKA